MKMEKENLGFLWIAVILICTLLIAILPTEAEAMIYEDTLRLHILADTNDEADQELKYEIKERLIGKYRDIFASGKSLADAEEIAMRELSSIERDVNLWIDELGFDYSASVTIGVEWYDTRVYESYSFPEGYYKSLIIRLGRGEGRNWWCVMYPPMCLDVATSDTPSYTAEEKRLISPSGYQIKFKILEGVSSFFK